MAGLMSLSVMQAQRAVSMAWTVGEDYAQPFHMGLHDALSDPKLRLEDGSSLGDDEVESLSRQVVLPGAKRAIHLDALEALHAAGLSVGEIVDEINGSMEVVLAPRVARFVEWRDGPLAEYVREVAERAERRRQLMAARSAQIDRQLDAGR